MNYSETIRFLFSHLPMFQRVGAAAFKKDLTNTQRLCEYLGNPQAKIRTIHVAGTNGKGSVSHILASVFMETGYKTGLYTSPHLLDFRERIKINGKMIPEGFVIDFTEKIKPAIEEIKPSFFEITVVMAFQAFAEAGVDMAVIETGLGGRLDSTNVIDPECSIITNISLEHQRFLGNTLREIAVEKAGIIKPGKPVIIGRIQKETNKVFEQIADEKNSPVFFADNYSQTRFEKISENNAIFHVLDKLSGRKFNLASGLINECQAENINTVFCFCRLMKDRFNITGGHISSGFKNVIQNTGLHGRWEILHKNPTVIIDIAHNRDAISRSLLQLKYYHFKHLFIVYGCSNDKDLDGILPLLPASAEYHFARPGVPRGMEVDLLAQEAHKYGIEAIKHQSVKEALVAVTSKMKPDDLLLITGSAFMVADAMRVMDYNTGFAIAGNREL